MTVSRLDSKSTPPGIEIAPATLAEAIDEGRRLTDRDRSLIDLLADHRVFTAEQVARLDFPNDTRARHRLVLLHRRGVLARFRRCVRPGSQPWRYTLGLLGEAIHAASSGDPLPRASAVRERIIRLAESRTLDHLLGVNDFFTTLSGHAQKVPNCELLDWWPESRVASICGKIVRPDGYGEWSENDRKLGFFLEYDNGTERLADVVEKIDKYAELATAGVTKPVLFVFPNTPRNHHFQQLAHRHGVPPSVPILSTDTDYLAAAQAAFADRVWLPVGGSRLVRLIDATAASVTPSRRTLKPAA
ncbi:replication-relaxation family protein [Amycolatopsis sp. cg5]|uniref:replication-relaxation family protein n=1 Tax=Amycolatopsis sp. cg5 TaxID=3238802 RepID=UPI0035267CB2